MADKTIEVTARGDMYEVDLPTGKWDVRSTDGRTCVLGITARNRVIAGQAARLVFRIAAGQSLFSRLWRGWAHPR